MRLVIAAAATLVVVAGRATAADVAPPAAGALAPCEQLAAAAQRVPSPSWPDGHTDWTDPLMRLRPILKIDEAAQPKRPFEIALAALPAVKAVLSNDLFSEEVDRLPGGDIYAVSQGRGAAMMIVFLDAPAGRKPKIIDGPPQYSDDWEYGYGSLGIAAGQPGFIELGDGAFLSHNADIWVTPWGGKHWNSSCHLRLHFGFAYTLTGHYCGDAAVCHLTRRYAIPIAAAYDREWQLEGGNPDATKGKKRFSFGPPPAGVDSAAVREFVAHHDPNAAWRELPTFRVKDPGPYAFSSTIFFPLMLGGRAYVAAVGHEQLTLSHEDSTALLAIYAVKGDTLAPMASFVIDRSIKNLVSATVDRPHPITDEGNIFRPPPTTSKSEKR